jgi:D-alanyl-D-alanine carboxypeptidase/D-alanyl-D-alanine-endopeptidase (penicillin-binding protein 4)
VPGRANPPISTASRWWPYNAGADALLLNYRAVLLTFTPERARRSRRSPSILLAGVRIDATVPG